MYGIVHVTVLSFFHLSNYNPLSISEASEVHVQVLTPRPAREGGGRCGIKDRGCVIWGMFTVWAQGQGLFFLSPAKHSGT